MPLAQQQFGQPAPHVVAPSIQAAFGAVSYARFPTDAKLLNRAREKLVALAKKTGIDRASPMRGWASTP